MPPPIWPGMPPPIWPGMPPPIWPGMPPPGMPPPMWPGGSAFLPRPRSKLAAFLPNILSAGLKVVGLSSRLLSAGESSRTRVRHGGRPLPWRARARERERAAALGIAGWLVALTSPHFGRPGHDAHARAARIRPGLSITLLRWIAIALLLLRRRVALLWRVALLRVALLRRIPLLRGPLLRVALLRVALLRVALVLGRRVLAVSSLLRRIALLRVALLRVALLRVALLRLLRRVLAVALLRWVCAALAVHCAHAKDTPRIASCFP